MAMYTSQFSTCPSTRIFIASVSKYDRADLIERTRLPCLDFFQHASVTFEIDAGDTST